MTGVRRSVNVLIVNIYSVGVPRLAHDQAYAVYARLYAGSARKDRVLKRRAKAPKLPLKGALRAFYYKVVIRKRFLACAGLYVQTSVGQYWIP